MTRINGFACFFLVALRLVIGWHFFIEGAYKIASHRIGKTATNTPWSGEGFFREGYGPLADWARQTLQLDAGLNLSRFRELDNGIQGDRPSEWNDYLEQFGKHYQLTTDQVAKAEALFQPLKKEASDWLAGKKSTTVKANVAWGVIERPMTVIERIANINASLSEIDDITANMRPAFGADVEKTRRRSLKADTANQIAELNAEYDDRFVAMQKALDSVLTDEQRNVGPVPTTTLTRRIVILDRITMWAHLILGACLLLGVFSRLSSFLLALFLLSVTLIAPALPWAPLPPGGVGHYIYINLYTIEMVALLVLMAIPTGRWFGLDALLTSIRARRQQPETFSIPGRIIPARPKR